MSTCTKSVTEFEKCMQDDIRNGHRLESAKQCLKIFTALRSSPLRMLTVEDLINVTGNESYNKAYTFSKHLKRSLLIGKHALPVYIKDSPSRTVPSMNKELTLVILKEDSETLKRQ